MNWSAVLNTIGLGLGMLGVAIVFVWGPPQPTLEEGIGLGLEDGTVLEDGRTVGEHDADVRRRRVRHQRLSKLGMAFIFFGFAVQVWATWS